MSRRVPVFHVLEPSFQLANRFFVICKLTNVYSFRVHNTTMPFPKTLYSTYYKNGRKFTIPVRKETSGEWSFDVYEDSIMSFLTVLLMVDASMQKLRTEDTEYVNLGEGKTKIGSKIKSGVQSVLNAVANNVVGMLSNQQTRIFRTKFQNVILSLNSGPFPHPLDPLGHFNLSIPTVDPPVMMVQLKELYLTSVEAINLDASNTTKPLSLHVTCQYNGLIAI